MSLLPLPTGRPIRTYHVTVEERDALMSEMFPKPGLGGRDHTLEAPPVLCLHDDRVFLEGGH